MYVIKNKPHEDYWVDVDSRVDPRFIRTAANTLYTREHFAKQFDDKQYAQELADDLATKTGDPHVVVRYIGFASMPDKVINPKRRARK